MKYIYLLLSALFIYSCDGNVKVSTDKDGEQKEINLKDLIGGSSDDGEKIEALDFRKIKEEFPRKLDGIKKSNSSGERAGAMGITYAQASADYHDDKRKYDVSVIDVGEAKSLMKMMAQWTTLEIDRESDNGYEKVGEIDGYKAFISYNNSTQSGERVIIIDDRLIVTVKGQGVSERELNSAVDDLDLSNFKNLIN